MNIQDESFRKGGIKLSKSLPYHALKAVAVVRFSPLLRNGNAKSRISLGMGKKESDQVISSNSLTMLVDSAEVAAR